MFYPNINFLFSLRLLHGIWGGTPPLYLGNHKKYDFEIVSWCYVGIHKDARIESSNLTSFHWTGLQIIYQIRKNLSFQHMLITQKFAGLSIITSKIDPEIWFQPQTPGAM